MPAQPPASSSDIPKQRGGALFAANIEKTKRQHLLGLFRVRLEQFEHHPDQRPLDDTWVVELKSKMELGLDRVSYPVSVVLSDDAVWEDVQGPALRRDGSAFLPSSLKVKVFDGQHRVMALRQLGIEPEEKWWVANLYQSELERGHPGVFYTMMHLGNEQEMKKPHEDADQFLLVYRLRCLEREGRIDAEECEESAKRIMGLPHSTARSSIPNLTRSHTFASFLAQMVAIPYVRPMFKLAGWKRLVDGRFYDLALWILQECREQMELLNGGTTHVVQEAFSLPANKCMWSHLEDAVKKPNHPWSALEGGALAALGRVRSRAENAPRTTPLLQQGEPNWTFESHILLPNVLTSSVVLDQIAIMKNLGHHVSRISFGVIFLFHLAPGYVPPGTLLTMDSHQQVVHVIAGPEGLKDYASKQARSHERFSPSGFILTTLGERALRKDGTVGDYHQQIMRFIWRRRRELSTGLDKEGIGSAPETQRNDYQRLIDQNKVWWELMRKFKMTRFPKGLKVQVVKEFPGTQAPLATPADQDSWGTGGDGPIRGNLAEVEVRPKGIVHNKVGSTPIGSDVEGSTEGPAPLDRGIAPLASIRADVGETATRAASSGPETAPVGSSSQTAPAPPAGAGPKGASRQGPGRKRRREAAVDETGEIEGRYLPNPAVLKGVGAGSLSTQTGEPGHRRLNSCMVDLQSKTRDMDRREAMAVTDLLQALADLPSGKVLSNVAGKLAVEIPVGQTSVGFKQVAESYDLQRLKKKAIKLARVDYDDAEDEDVATAGTQHSRQRGTAKPVGTEGQQEQSYAGEAEDEEGEVEQAILGDDLQG
ncbi:hypothetical protein FS749_000180 [Ceratobasidium sp. UAMH 11750]|nr:hypothetical protein FS749_000180 [Ceratobasidium sp. UAMH 11750]